MHKFAYDNIIPQYIVFCQELKSIYRDNQHYIFQLISSFEII